MYHLSVGDPTPRCSDPISDPINIDNNYSRNNRCNINVYNISGSNIDNNNDSNDKFISSRSNVTNISGSNI